MRILHCPNNVGGNAWVLSRAERRLGLHSELMVFNKSWLGYSADVALQLDRHFLVRSLWRLLSYFVRALAQYDVFHFNFGSSLLPYGNYPWFLELSDLPVLRRLGKKIIVTYQGSDIRQRTFFTTRLDISACDKVDCYGNVFSTDSDSAKKRRIRKFDRYAHKIFSLNPDLLYVLPSRAEFLPYSCVDLEKWRPAKSSIGKKLVILHAPTNRDTKGTKYIAEAVEKLKNQYKDVELMLVEKTPHNKVQELYEKADLAVDQLLIGWYGGFAVEMMALGKPVVCYIREEDLKFIPSQMKEDLPIINANKFNIYEVLKCLIAEREKFNLIGQRSRAYVEIWHDPMKIAKRMKETYESLFVE